MLGVAGGELLIPTLVLLLGTRDQARREPFAGRQPAHDDRCVRRFFTAIPNRILHLSTNAADQIWVGDVTYLRSAHSWRYLAVVIDRHSRRILGWALGARRDLTLTLAALHRALLRRRLTTGLVLHSDHGVEYSAYAYRRFDHDHVLRSVVATYIRRYNRRRLHPAPEYRPPIDYELRAA